MTDVACMILELVKSSADSRATMNNAIDAFRGSNNKAVRDKGLDRLPMFGQGKQCSRELVERIFQHLAAADALREELYTNKMGYSNPYIVVCSYDIIYGSPHSLFLKLGEYAGDYVEGRKKFVISVSQKDKGKATTVSAPSASSAPNKYVAPVTTRHTVKKKHSTTIISKTVHSINRTDDWDHGFDSEPEEEPSNTASASRVTDDVEEEESYSIPPGFFDDPDVIETQIEEPPSPPQKTRANSRPVRMLVPDSDVEEDDAMLEGGFEAQFKRLKALRVKVCVAIEYRSKTLIVCNRWPTSSNWTIPTTCSKKKSYKSLPCLSVKVRT